MLRMAQWAGAEAAPAMRKALWKLDSRFYSPKGRAMNLVTQAFWPQEMRAGPKRLKQKMIAWLTERAVELELVLPSGKINKTAIEEVASCANWETGPGMGKTPKQAPLFILVDDSGKIIKKVYQGGQLFIGPDDESPDDESP
jgi:hypothetical protein